MSVKIAATDHTRRQFANTYHQVPHVGWASAALLTCSGMCRYALGRQSHEDSGHINGVFDPTVDKAVNLIDSEMTVARELTEDFVTGIAITYKYYHDQSLELSSRIPGVAVSNPATLEDDLEPDRYCNDQGELQRYEC
ncbi:uncharacterized protein FFB14_06574 [Fusarium fujikuroi]|nr:uncharacterized protein FFB14_06574 [Fusarium fujikuroi]